VSPSAWSTCECARDDNPANDRQRTGSWIGSIPPRLTIIVDLFIE
jgi:hypothetical protein